MKLREGGERTGEGMNCRVDELEMR